ncbi:MAG: type 4a pilus biogenesis protein PilO [Candidatus Omnitrophica bacterium]|nr:type 4a pilus biogenesis protein PilO [Candidatus Omnitrophota bacterium]
MMPRLLEGLRPRERRLALAALLVIGSWLFVSGVVRPLAARGGEVRRHVETQREKLDALRRVLAQASDIEQDYQQLAVYLDGADGEPAQGAFFSELESIARSVGVTLNLKPRHTKTDERISRLEVELDVEGSQQNLLAFLDALLRMPKLVAIDRLRLSTIPAREGFLRANLVLSKLSILN